MPERAPKSRAVSRPRGQRQDPLRDVLAQLVDPAWYTERHRDLATADMTPVDHFIRHGLAEGRDPNAWFDSAWYASTYPDVATSGLEPLAHYLHVGAARLRDPGPDFDAVYYAETHPDAADNPLLYHCQIGRRREYNISWTPTASDYSPVSWEVPAPPAPKQVDIIVMGASAGGATRRCLNSILNDPSPLRGRVLVVDDGSASPDLLRWLESQHEKGSITSLQRRRRDSSVAALNAAIEAAGARDVVLLDGCATVPEGWLARLAAHAYAAPRTATVSPFSDAGEWCGYPTHGASPVSGVASAQIDLACETVNRGRSVIIPAASRLCMYIRREALRRFGLLDTGFGDDWHVEFSARAAANGWQNRLACDTFIAGAIASDADDDSATEAALSSLYPDAPNRLASHRRRDMAAPFRFAVTARLIATSDLPVIVMVYPLHGWGARLAHR